MRELAAENDLDASPPSRGRGLKLEDMYGTAQAPQHRPHHGGAD